MAIADLDIARAEAAMRKRLAETPRALRAGYDAARREIVVDLSDGSEFAFAPARSTALREAPSADLDPVEISAAGLGLHWPRLDVDLYLPALFEGVFDAIEPSLPYPPAKGHAMRFEIYKGHDGDWRWRLRASNGNVVADAGEGYRRREDCEHGIELVKGSATAPTVDMSLKIAGGTER